MPWICLCATSPRPTWPATLTICTYTRVPPHYVEIKYGEVAVRAYGRRRYTRQALSVSV
jgi:hypothetical protein